MKLSNFTYELPEKLLAEYPSDQRDESRLMVLHRDSKEIWGCSKSEGCYIKIQSKSEGFPESDGFYIEIQRTSEGFHRRI